MQGVLGPNFGELFSRVKGSIGLLRLFQLARKSGPLAILIPSLIQEVVTPGLEKIIDLAQGDQKPIVVVTGLAWLVYGSTLVSLFGEENVVLLMNGPTATRYYTTTNQEYKQLLPSLINYFLPSTYGYRLFASLLGKILDEEYYKIALNQIGESTLGSERIQNVLSGIIGGRPASSYSQPKITLKATNKPPYQTKIKNTAGGYATIELPIITINPHGLSEQTAELIRESTQIQEIRIFISFGSSKMFPNVDAFISALAVIEKEFPKVRFIVMNTSGMGIQDKELLSRHASDKFKTTRTTILPAEEATSFSHLIANTHGFLFHGGLGTAETVERVVRELDQLRVMAGLAHLTEQTNYFNRTVASLQLPREAYVPCVNIGDFPESQAEVLEVLQPIIRDMVAKIGITTQPTFPGKKNAGIGELRDDEASQQLDEVRQSTLALLFALKHSSL